MVPLAGRAVGSAPVGLRPHEVPHDKEAIGIRDGRSPRHVGGGCPGDSGGERCQQPGIREAAFTRPVDLMFKITEDHEPGTQVLHVLNAQDTVVQQIVFGPGGHTGWHSHPGPVVVLVAQGELTLYSS